MHSILSVIPTSVPYALPLEARGSMLGLRKLACQIKENELLTHYPYLVGANFQRKVEHHAGRICAARAILALNIISPLISGILIKSGSKGEPIWPTGIIGSITHTQDFACAVVAPASAYIGIGIDSEKCLDEIVCSDISTVCLSSKERKQLLINGLLTQCQIVTVIFCIKEAFYKAAYPHVQRFIDFDELEITNIDSLSGLVSMRSEIFSFSSIHIYGWFVMQDDYVHACVVLHENSIDMQPARLRCQIDY